jgi:hypothetical protein
MNAVWDKVFMWSDVMLTNERFQTEKISFSVQHRANWGRNSLIGSYEFSLGNIYRQKNHQYYELWVPLRKPDKPGFDEGHLKLTVYVLGPNDPTPPHEPASEQKQEEDNDEGKVLETPGDMDVKMFVLNVLVYKAKDVLETQYGEKQRGADGQARLQGIQPFVSARFNGNTIRTAGAVADSAGYQWKVRLELPFTLPLRSDVIEVILWNEHGLPPAVIIGRATFNFFQMGLSHQAWGPRWVNLYSNQYHSPHVTLLGKIKHAMAEITQQKHEYVGRVMMRMSVEPKEDALLMHSPAAEAIEPISDDYTLQVLLYYASEIPILGGGLAVELTWGPDRKPRKLPFVFGNNGVFKFYSRLPPIQAHIPRDKSQVYDVFINVYWQNGATVQKIAFEQIPISSLVPANGGTPGFLYFNGDTRVPKSAKMASWPSKWRALQHVHPDEKKKHVTAGFLLTSIAFGLSRDFPQDYRLIPEPRPAEHTRYTLRVYVHQAANLLAAMSNGCSNPVLAIRYAGRSLVLPCKQRDTLFPLWFECRELPGLYLDLLRAPSVYLMVLHQTTLGYVTLGRAEIATQHIRANPAKLMRYRIRWDQDAPAGAEAADSVPGASPLGSNKLAVNAAGEPVGVLDAGNKSLNDYLISTMASRPREDIEPYVLAAFELFPSAERASFPLDPKFPPPLKDFFVKVEMIGLRELNSTPALMDSGLLPEVEVAVPKLEWDPKGGRNPQTLQATKKQAETESGANNGAASDGTSSSGGTISGGGPDFDYVDLDTPAIAWDISPAPCATPSGMGIQVLNAATFSKVSLPITDPYSIPLRIRVLNSTSKDTCYCSRFVPISEMLGRALKGIHRPPTYRYHAPLGSRFKAGGAEAGASPGGGSSEDSMGVGSMQSGGVIGGGPNANSIIELDEDEEKLAAPSMLAVDILASPSETGASPGDSQYTTLTGSDGVVTSSGAGARTGRVSSRRMTRKKATLDGTNDIPREYKAGITLTLEEEEGDADEAGGAATSQRTKAKESDEKEDPYTLELDTHALNVQSGTSSAETKVTREWRAGGASVPKGSGDEDDAAEAKAEIKEDEEEDESEEWKKRPKLRSLSLFRNKYSSWSGPSGIIEACVLKCFVRCIALPDKVSETRKIQAEIGRDDLIVKIAALYQKTYMARVYIYTGINLAPLTNWLDGEQSSNPYIVAFNGSSEHHKVNYSSRAKKDDLNPEFFQQFDLRTKIPENCKLEVQVWNSGLVMDDLIGSVVIDLETRLLQQHELDELARLEGRDSGFVSTTEYHDLKNETAATSQGKLSMRLEMLTEEEARNTKPDNVIPTPPEEYELRMVLWTSRGVRFPQAEDAVSGKDRETAAASGGRHATLFVLIWRVIFSLLSAGR